MAPPRPLHARRRRQKELAEREAAGEDLWTEEIDGVVRERIALLVSELIEPSWYDQDVLQVQQMFLRELGMDLNVSDCDGLLRLVKRPGLDSATFPSMIEAIALVHEGDDGRGEDLDVFEREMNGLFAEERIAFRMVEGQMVEFRSMEMHAEVVEPTIRLLHRSAGWEKVQEAYRSALAEIGQDPSDAITDAGRALQEALTLLGCKGNALGPLATDAKKKGLVAAHDVALLHWVSADRSEKGDGHKASDATRDDAWLAVHVVGALILRLASDEPRT